MIKYKPSKGSGSQTGKFGKKTLVKLEQNTKIPFQKQ